MHDVIMICLWSDWSDRVRHECILTQNLVWQHAGTTRWRKSVGTGDKLLRLWWKRWAWFYSHVSRLVRWAKSSYGDVSSNFMTSSYYFSHDVSHIRSDDRPRLQGRNIRVSEDIVNKQCNARIRWTFCIQPRTHKCPGELAQKSVQYVATSWYRTSIVQ